MRTEAGGGLGCRALAAAAGRRVHESSPSAAVPQGDVGAGVQQQVHDVTRARAIFATGRPALNLGGR